MIIGFTGSRDGLSDIQIAWLYKTFEAGKADGTIKEVHHGACVGADEAVHVAALDNDVRVHAWPPTNPKYLAQQCLNEHPRVTVHPAMPYLNRDREIVHATKGLIALPKQNEQPPRMLWGGTWYTVDYAERTRKPVYICYPNGRTETRDPKGDNNIWLNL